MTWQPYISEQCRTDKHGYCPSLCDCKCHYSRLASEVAQRSRSPKPWLFCRSKDHCKCPAVLDGDRCGCSCHAKKAVA